VQLLPTRELLRLRLQLSGSGSGSGCFGCSGFRCGSMAALRTAAQLLGLAAAALLGPGSATKGMGGAPSLGFNNCNIECCNETMPNAFFVRRTADLFVKLGLKEAGYLYVNMDDCWEYKERAENGTGAQVPVVSKFPDGIKNGEQRFAASQQDLPEPRRLRSHGLRARARAPLWPVHRAGEEHVRRARRQLRLREDRRGTVRRLGRRL